MSAAEFEEVLSAESVEDSKVGIEQFMNRYSELMNSESDWVQLFSRELLSKEYHIKILAIKLKVDFIVRADVNLTMGTDLSTKSENATISGSRSFPAHREAAKPTFWTNASGSSFISWATSA